LLEESKVVAMNKLVSLSKTVGLPAESLLSTTSVTVPALFKMTGFLLAIVAVATASMVLPEAPAGIKSERLLTTDTPD
jgi:hypothetical protein